MKLKYKYYSLQGGMQKVKTRTALAISAAMLAVSGGTGLSLLAFSSAHADTGGTVIVTPTDTQGWGNRDTGAGGSTAYVADADTSFGDAALQLTTDGTNTAKADYFKSADNMPLKDVTELAYNTKQVTASSAGGSASYQLAIDVNGDAEGGLTTLVYEPYWQNNESPDAAPVQPNVWQNWDVDQGIFWSSQSVGGMTAGRGGSPFYTLAEVEQMNPDAVVQAYGVNVGTYNPDYTINVDGVIFNGTTYDFEAVAPDTTAPAVAIINPTDGQTVQGTVDVRGTVTDVNPDHYYLKISDSANHTVYSHTYAEDQSITDQSIYAWNTTNVADGTYTIQLEARDAAGNKDASSIDAISVVVNNTVDNKDQCKDGAWANFTKPSFKNQGECVSYTNHNNGVGQDDVRAKNN